MDLSVPSRTDSTPEAWTTPGRWKPARELGLEPSEKLRVRERLILDRRPAGELSPGIAPGLPMPARAAATGPQDRIALLEREIADLRDASVRPG